MVALVCRSLPNGLLLACRPSLSSSAISGLLCVELPEHLLNAGQ